MDLIKEDLRTRSDEVGKILELIKFLERTGAITDESGNSQLIDSSLRNTLKGQIFLLLYNLIESTMRESIGHIHETLNGREVSFNELRKELRMEVLKRTKSSKIGVDKLCQNTALDISKQLLVATFEKEEIFSGNIDHRKICEQAEIYGFNTIPEYQKQKKQQEYQETKYGSSLRIVKDKRNDLAHGISSFSKIGDLYSIQDIENFVNEVISYLESITTHITNYLSQHDYLTKQDELSSTDQ